MHKKWPTISAILLSALLGACDKQSESTDSDPTTRDEASTATATPTLKVATPTASPKIHTSATSTVAASASVVLPEPPPPPPPPEPPKEIRVHDPEGVEFVLAEKWHTVDRDREPDANPALEPVVGINWDILNAMNHAENAPILDIVVMYSAVSASAENERHVLRNIMAAHLKRGWGDISAHYLIGPSGTVYQGRHIWYRSEKSAGSGMGRFSDPWSKCVIMLLGKFASPDEFTPEMQNTLTTLIDDRRSKFGRMYQKSLEAREEETKILLSPQQKGPFGHDKVRVFPSPSLPPILKSSLKEGDSNNTADGGSNASTAGDGGTRP